MHWGEGWQMHKHVRFLSSGYLTQGAKQGMASGVLPLGVSRKTSQLSSGASAAKVFPSCICTGCLGPNTSKYPRESSSVRCKSSDLQSRDVWGLRGCLTYQGFQPSGLSVSEMCALSLLYPAQLEVTLALMMSQLNPRLRGNLR